MQLLLEQQQVRVGADKISKTFSNNNISGKGMTLNVTDNNQISELINSISEDYGSVDILINNAGITRDKLIDANERRRMG